MQKKSQYISFSLFSGIVIPMGSQTQHIYGKVTLRTTFYSGLQVKEKIQGVWNEKYRVSGMEIQGVRKRWCEV